MARQRLPVQGLFDHTSAAQVRDDMFRAGEQGPMDVYNTNLAATRDPLIAMGRQGLAMQRKGINRAGDAAARAMGSKYMPAKLKKAMKLDRDAKEITSILEGMSSPDSDGAAMITEKEIKIGFSELMKRGYDKQAQEWLAMAQSMQGMDIKEKDAESRRIAAEGKGEANKTAAASLAHRKLVQKWKQDHPEGTVHKRGTVKDEAGNTFIESSWTPKRAGPNATAKMFWTPTDPSRPDLKPVGKTVLVESSQGVAASEEAGLAGDKQKQIEIQKRITNQKRIDAELTAEGEKRWQVEREGLLAQAINMRPKITQIARLAKLAETVQTGGYRDDLLGLKEYFGKAPANETEFDTQTKNMVKSMLSEMGRNPTDFDLKFLLSINPGMMKTREGNIRILKMMQSAYENRYENIRWLGKGSAAGEPRTRGEWDARMLPPSKELISKYNARLEKIIGPKAAKAGQKKNADQAKLDKLFGKTGKSN